MMAGRDRILDPKTGDYVSDGKGGWQETTDLRTAAWHQLADEKGHWVGDPDAGSDLWKFQRVGASVENENAIKDSVTQALKLFTDAGRAADLVVTTTRDPLGRIEADASLRDVQHGTINIAPIKPGGP